MGTCHCLAPPVAHVFLRVLDLFLILCLPVDRMRGSIGRFVLAAAVPGPDSATTGMMPKALLSAPWTDPDQNGSSRRGTCPSKRPTREKHRSISVFGRVERQQVTAAEEAEAEKGVTINQDNVSPIKLCRNNLFLSLV